MLNRGSSTLVESVLVLALMGILAGAIGGLAVGVATSPKASSPSTATR
jgi:type II secretory pathway pseudopilin PulG